MSAKNEKIPLYVTVYNNIFNMIKEGIYNPGDQLPSEHVLSEMFNVSRGTLRQALLLLQEDGLVINYQGKGNFVTPNHSLKQTGLEELNNAQYTFCKGKITQRQIELTFQVSTKKQEEALELQESQLLAVLDILYLQENDIQSHTMAFIPYKVLDHHQVKLDDLEALMQFYDNYSQKEMLWCKSHFKVVKARESTAERMQIQAGDYIIMMEDVFYTDKGKPAMRQKSFFLIDSYEFLIHRKRTN